MRTTTSRRWLTALAAAGLLLAGAACGGDDPTTEVADAEVVDDEYKVTVAGDSISVGLGASVRAAVDEDIVVKVIGVDGTGLARPEVFDWPARLAELARDFPPEVLVLSLASNDAQDLTDASGQTVVPFADEAAWDAAYAERLAASVDPFESTGTTVIWVGHVHTADPTVGETNRRVHALATEVAAGRDWVEVEDLADLLGTGEAPATRCLVPDGLHLSIDCLDEAAELLVADLPGR